MSRFRPSLHIVILALPLAFLALFYVYPLISVVRISFVPGLLSQGAGIFASLTEARALNIILFSVGQATLSTALTLLLGLPMAHVFARYTFWGRGVWRAIATLPFVMPTVVVAAAFEAYIGSRGLLNTALQALLGLSEPPIRLMNSLSMILIAHVFYNVSVVIRIVGSFWSLINPQIEEVAASLGANRMQVFWRVTLGMARPAIGAATLLVFVFSFTSFGVILLLGGPQFATIEVEIYNQTAQLLRLDIATSLAIVQLLITLLLSLISARLQARANVPLEATRPNLGGNRPSRSAHWLIVGVLIVIIGLVVAPLLTLLARSLAWGSDDLLRFYRTLDQNPRGSFFFVPPLIAMRNSVTVAGLTALLALGFGLPLAYSVANVRRGWLARVLDVALLLPLGTSALTLGLGYLVAFAAPIDLRTSPLLLPCAHTLIALPFVVRTLAPALRAISPVLRESAANLGASPLQVLRQIDLPLLRGPLLAALIFAFAISLGEFGASILIARPDYPTLPLVIARFLGQPGALNYGQALAMSAILMGVTVAATVGMERVGAQDIHYPHRVSGGSNTKP